MMRTWLKSEARAKAFNVEDAVERISLLIGVGFFWAIVITGAINLVK